MLCWYSVRCGPGVWGVRELHHTRRTLHLQTCSPLNLWSMMPKEATLLRTRRTQCHLLTGSTSWDETSTYQTEEGGGEVQRVSEGIRRYISRTVSHNVEEGHLAKVTIIGTCASRAASATTLGPSLSTSL